MFEPAGFDVCLTVGLVLFAFGVALPYVRLALGRPSGGIDGAPTVVELFGEGKGWRGTRLDISYDIALIGVLFILQATAQTNYPDGYLKTIHLGVTVWPMLSLVYVVFKLVQLQSSRIPDKTFDRMFSMGRWFMCRRRRCWCRLACESKSARTWVRIKDGQPRRRGYDVDGLSQVPRQGLPSHRE